MLDAERHLIVELLLKAQLDRRFRDRVLATIPPREIIETIHFMILTYSGDGIGLIVDFVALACCSSEPSLARRFRSHLRRAPLMRVFKSWLTAGDLKQRILACITLQRVGGKECLPLLRKGLTKALKDDPIVVRYFLDAIVSLGGEVSSSFLAPSRSSRPRACRWGLVDRAVITWLPPHTATELLLKIARKEEDPFVLAEIQRTVQEILASDDPIREVPPTIYATISSLIQKKLADQHEVRQLSFEALCIRFESYLSLCGASDYSINDLERFVPYADKAYRNQAMRGRYRCSCCGTRALPFPAGSFSLCERCGWVDDPFKLAKVGVARSANSMTLVRARKVYRQLKHFTRPLKPLFW